MPVQAIVKRRSGLYLGNQCSHMSIYCLGKLKGAPPECRAFLLGAAGDAGLGLSFDIDPEDAAVLGEAADLRGEGVIFAVHSTPGDSDLIEAWDVTRDAGLEKLGACITGPTGPGAGTQLRDLSLSEPVRRELAVTSLGRFAAAVISFEGAEAGGLAFFDGSIRRIVPGTPEDCVRNVLAGFLPWHCGPDALYVWKRGSRG